MSSGASPQGLGQLLDAFDWAWAAYLQRFVAWKFADAAALESELIKVAIEMEASVLSKTGGDTSPDKQRSEDLQVRFLTRMHRCSYWLCTQNFLDNMCCG